jgi:hypothetical protein
MNANVSFKIYPNVPGDFTLKVLRISHTPRYPSETLHIHCCHLVDTSGITTRVIAITVTFLLHFKDGGKKKHRLVLSLYFLLPDLLCYILLHSIHISTNFKVFPFELLQGLSYRQLDLGMSFRWKLTKRGLSLLNQCAWHLLPHPVQRHRPARASPRSKASLLSCPFTLWIAHIHNPLFQGLKIII